MEGEGDEAGLTLVPLGGVRPRYVDPFMVVCVRMLLGVLFAASYHNVFKQVIDHYPDE